MTKKREQLYQIYHALISMALTWALTLVINQYFNLKVHFLFTAVFSLIPSLIVYLFDLYKKNIISYILVFSFIPVLAVILWINKLNPISWIENYYIWCMNYSGEGELYRAAFARFTIFYTAVLGTIFIYMITRKQLAKIILAIAILAALIVLSVSHVNVQKAVVGIGIFYIMTIVVELYGTIYSKKEGRQDKKEGILYLAPICLLLAISSIGIPAKEEPIKWTLVKNAYRSIKDQFEEWQTDLRYYFGDGQSEFTLSATGYSESDGSLGSASLVKDPSIALKVSGLGKDDSLYLTGSISDIYTGNSWVKSGEDYLPNETDFMLDYSELFFAMTRQDFDVLENNYFVQRENVKVTFEDIRTKTFFYSLKTSDYEMKNSHTKLLEESAQIKFEKSKGRGTTYNCTYFEMNLQGEAFQNMLREADSFSYDNSPPTNLTNADWLQANAFQYDNVKTLLDRKSIYKILGEREKIINARYTTLPEGLPERVRELANDITVNYDTKYDKLKALESYLLRYTYTPEPGELPEGEDFVDYFLFENKKGYCTSFATSMAVLGRCIGVPTRYVEGFVVRGKYKNNENICEVKNSQAHAWAEAYIKGVGWIPFEATATYYDNRYSKWPTVNKGVTSITSTVNPYDYSAVKDQYLKMKDKSEKDKLMKKGNSPDIWKGVAIFLAVLCILIISVIIYYDILKYRHKKAYEKADNTKKMYLLFLRILSQMKREGFTLEQQETILMLAKRVKNYLEFDGLTFREVANIYMRYRYAGKEITPLELNQVATFHKGLTEKRKQETKRFKLWREEYVFLIQTDRQLKRQYSNT